MLLFHAEWIFSSGGFQAPNSQRRNLYRAPCTVPKSLDEKGGRFAVFAGVFRMRVSTYEWKDTSRIPRLIQQICPVRPQALDSTEKTGAILNT